MLCTIITPTFNNHAYLTGALRSVSAQTYQPIEHWIIDGGSTDDTTQILGRLDRIRWLSEPDRGMYDAINKGIARSSGEVLAYLNADDRYFPDTVEAVMREFIKDDTLDFVFGYCTFIDERQQPICTFRTLPFHRWLVTRRGRVTFAQPTCFWRRRVHDRVGVFDGDFRHVGDADFFCRLVITGCRGKLLRRPLASFMVRDDCISNKFSTRMASEADVVKRRYRVREAFWRYGLNETAYYLVNVDSYCRYVQYKARRWTQRQMMRDASADARTAGLK